MPKNNPPKNFKNMAFPPSRYGTPSSIASPIPKTVKQPDPFKDYLNTLRCPVCKGQIDGVGNPFYCATDREHYKIYLNGINSPYHEVVVVYDAPCRYEIIQQPNHTNIFFNRNMDASLGGQSLLTAFDFKIFDFSKTNREKILHKLKTILVFQ